MAMNIGQFLDIAAFKYPDKPAMICGDRRFTYRQVLDRVQRLMSGLARLGVTQGDRVATLMWNCAEMMEIHLAAIRLGALFTPFNSRLKGPELRYLTENAEPAVLFVDEDCEAMAAETLGDAFAPERWFTTSRKPVSGMKPYEALLQDNGPYDGSVTVRPEDPCQLLYTSGTTARPKGVILSHENVLWNCFNMLQARRDRSEDVSLVVGPLFHAAALNSHFVPRLALGGTLILLKKFEPGHMMALIAREGATVVPGNPTLFIMLLDHCVTKRYDTSGVTTLSSGSDKLPDAVKRGLMTLFPGAEGVFDIYGMTECGPCVSCLDARDSLRKTACVGPALPFVQVRLLDDDGNEVPRGETGEVVVQGPNVMKGYYGLPEETEKVLRDGWLYSGDLARADEEGFLYIVDRKKDMIVTGGENVAARDVEEALFSHPAVLKAAVFGLADPKWGEAVSAAVVVREGNTLTVQELQTFLRGRIAGYKVPKRIFFEDALPESGAGKVQKHLLKRRYAGIAPEDSPRSKTGCS